MGRRVVAIKGELEALVMKDGRLLEMSRFLDEDCSTDDNGCPPRDERTRQINILPKVREVRGRGSREGIPSGRRVKEGFVFRRVRVPSFLSSLSFLLMLPRRWG